MKIKNKQTKLNPWLLIPAVPLALFLLAVLVGLIALFLPFATLYFIVNRICQVAEENNKNANKRKCYLAKLENQKAWI